MAILINKQIDDVLGSITIDKVYIRFSITLGFDGKSIHIWAKNYLDKRGYLNNPELGHVEINGLPNKYNFDYNRVLDGLDFLNFAHAKVIEFLTSDIKESLPQTDPETGELILDPETSEPILAEEIVLPRFCEIGEINITDFD